MAITTGSPVGNLDVQEGIFIEGAPISSFKIIVLIPSSILMLMGSIGIFRVRQPTPFTKLVAL